MSNVRIVPIQKLCVLCGHELRARDVSEGLASRLCRACIQMIREQVVRGVEGQQKIVRV
jgi:hypothetical protein